MEKSGWINIIYMTDVKEAIKWLFHSRLIDPPMRAQSDHGAKFQGAVKVLMWNTAYNILCISSPSSREVWEVTWNLEKHTKIDILNCVEGDKYFLVFILMKSMGLMAMPSLYSNHL